MKSHSITERVRWSDVDAAGIIFYGAYIRFFEIAETELFRAAGLSYRVMYEELGVWLPRVHLECDFKRPAQLDDELEVTARVVKLGRTSLGLEFEVRTPGTEPLIARAAFTMVAVDRVTFEKVNLPQELTQRLQ